MRNIFRDTLEGKVCERPPVWFMRQAGRTLPSYMKLRESYGFKHMMDNPELASKVTLLPIEDIGVDAAILFSDILVIPEALGMNLTFEGKGPNFDPALKDVEDPLSYLSDMPEKLDHIYKALDNICKDKPDNIGLIGFCGAPLTTLCYMYQGFSRNQMFPDFVPALYKNRDQFIAIIDKIVDMSINYATTQCDHGIDAFQLFDTHAGLIPVDLYNDMFLPACKKILAAVRAKGVKTIFLPKGLGAGIENISTEICDVLSVDWQTPMDYARKMVGNDMILQGNFDPRILETDRETIKREFLKLAKFGEKDSKFIFNLGHGLTPSIPVENIKYLVELIKNHNWNRK